jgi:hypothetical protein
MLSTRKTPRRSGRRAKKWWESRSNAWASTAHLESGFDGHSSRCSPPMTIEFSQVSPNPENVSNGYLTVILMTGSSKKRLIGCFRLR